MVRRLQWLLLALLLSAEMVPCRAADVGHRPGLRDQWMPQTEHDPRLQQPVHIEIIGRAATAAMKLLSDATGVSLGVTPEDMETVGERKLTIIAQGCSLKALLVQIPKALQECHVDIDTSGKEPVYLLHRNGDVETTMVQLMEAEPRQLQEESRPAREARIDAARKALAMSPEELTELAKTDPLLAAAAKDPETRKWMEAFFAMPRQALDQFGATGDGGVGYGAAPASIQKTVRDFLQTKAQEEQGGSDLYKTVLGQVEEARLDCEDYDLFSSGEGIWLRIYVFTKKGSRYSANVPLIPPRSPDERAAQHFLRDLVAKAAAAQGKPADVLTAELVKQHEAEDLAARDQKRAQWREPRSPELHEEIMLPFDKPVDTVEVQQFLAKATGLSLVSDYFTTWGPREIPKEARARMPVWRLLYLLGEKWFWTYDWNEAGDCLVFSDRGWFRRVPAECPESLVLAYREKLKTQGALTLDDAAAFAVALDRRRPTRPELRKIMPSIPTDLEKAGLASAMSPDGLLIYATLTPEQKVKARSEAGLPYQELTAAQQALVQRSTHEYTAPVPDEEIPEAVFHITQSSRTVGKPGEGDILDAGTYDVYSLTVKFRERETGSYVPLRVSQSRPSPKP